MLLARRSRRSNVVDPFGHLKLEVTFFYNIVVGCVLRGLIGPLATGKYAHFLTLDLCIPRVQLGF
jgi:hypothetical protein